MDKLYKLLAILIFLAFSLVTAEDSIDNNTVIIDRIIQENKLDIDQYEIEILSNNLRTKKLAEHDFTITPLTQKEPLGLYSVLVKVYDDTKVIETSQIRTRVKKYANVVICNDQIKRNDEITEDLLEIKRTEITNLIEKPIFDPTDALGLRASRNLRKGQVLTTASIEFFPDVVRGKEITIVYVDGLCRISTAGEALQEGRAGEYVKVKNKSSGKIIIARIIDSNAVAIEL